MSSISRRNFLVNAGVGLGAASLAQGGLIADAQAEGVKYVSPLAAKEGHFKAKAKSVIWLHQHGAPSTLDLYDYKPVLQKLSGQEVPASFLQGLQTGTQGGVGKLFATNRTWKQHGESGAWFSDLVPNIAKHADDIAFIKSSVTIGATHDISILKLNTGELTPGRPSLGAWVQYALGSANADLPAYVVLYHGEEPSGGGVNWSSGFLPAVYQGTVFRQGDSPIVNLALPEGMTRSSQRSNLDLLKKLNEYKASRYPVDTELQARIEAYELAYRMQTTAPEAVDLTKESDATRKLYGLDNPVTEKYGTNLLRARRLVERGVRFVQVVTGPHSNENLERTNWDAHDYLEENHTAMTAMVDKPIGALLADLKSRGLLDETLVVWTSEFGRTSYGESGNGRDHNPWGYTQWLAGGGVKAGFTHGETDEIGLRTADPGKAVDTYDLHATVLKLLGLDHLRVTFLNMGRSERPTVTFGKVIDDLIA